MGEWMLEENGPLTLDVDTGATVGERMPESDYDADLALVEFHNRDIRKLRAEIEKLRAQVEALKVANVMLDDKVDTLRADAEIGVLAKKFEGLEIHHKPFCFWHVLSRTDPAQAHCQAATLVWMLQEKWSVTGWNLPDEAEEVG